MLLGAGIGPVHLTAALGVFKAYQPRVGAGPMPTELLDETGEAIRQAGHEFGTTTGRPRRCGWFDVVANRHSVRINGFSSLVLTRLDILDGLPTIRICTGYEQSGRRVDELPARVEVLERCQPVYEELPGWRTSTSAATSWSELPLQARRYVERVSELLGLPISLIGVGQGRHQVIALDESLLAG
jgi:adenylosuccinate synthase